MFLSILAAILLAVWVLLTALGKGGFIHLLLLNAFGLIVVDLVRLYRSRLTASVNEP
jgi:hypothetical protein